MIAALILLAVQPVQTIGDWKVTREVDAMSDQVIMMATSTGDTGQVVFRCNAEDPSSPTLIWLPTDFLGAAARADQRTVTYRSGSGPVRTKQWSYRATSAVLMEDMDGTLREIGTGDRLAIRGQTYEGHTVTTVVGSRSASAAFRAAFAGCNLPAPAA